MGSGDDDDDDDALCGIVPLALEPPRIALTAVCSPRALRSPRATCAAMAAPSPFTLEPAAVVARNADERAPLAGRSPRARAQSPGSTLPTGPMTPCARAARDDEWSTVPVRRAGGQRRGAAATDGRVRAERDGAQQRNGTHRGAGGWSGEGEEEEGDPLGLLERLSDKSGRNPQGKKNNQFMAVLKRESAVGRRNAQRGGPKRA